MAWAEDKAIRGRDPSADPGAKTEGRATCLCVSARRQAAGRPSSPALRDWHQSDKSLGAQPRARACENDQNPGDGLPESHNSRGSVLHFTLNQYTGT